MGFPYVFFFLFLVPRSYSSYPCLVDEEVKWSAVLYQLLCLGYLLPIEIEIEETEKLPYFHTFTTFQGSVTCLHKSILN